jgi:hypothetical protein
MDYIERRERALVIFEEKIRLIPTDVQVECALFGCSSEMYEVAEEICEWLRATRAFPKAPKQELFFGDD